LLWFWFCDVLLVTFGWEIEPSNFRWRMGWIVWFVWIILDGSYYLLGLCMLDNLWKEDVMIWIIWYIWFDFSCYFGMGWIVTSDGLTIHNYFCDNPFFKKKKNIKTDIYSGTTTCRSANIWHMSHNMDLIIRVTSMQ